MMGGILAELGKTGLRRSRQRARRKVRVFQGQGMSHELYIWLYSLVGQLFPT